jgi:ATP:corrinoid adenosyltransferase BtuR/CobO/CobP
MTPRDYSGSRLTRDALKANGKRGVNPPLQPTGEESNERHAEQMRRRKASYDARKAAATKEKGLIIVHTGTGKGKTSAALGMIFRFDTAAGDEWLNDDDWKRSKT